MFFGKVSRQSPASDTTLIDWSGQPLLARHHPQFAVGEGVCWLIPEAGVVLVREHQLARENTFGARVSDRLAWRGHATVTAHVGGRREAALSFAIGASVAQRRRIVPGADILLQLQKEALCLFPADQMSGAWRGP